MPKEPGLVDFKKAAEANKLKLVIKKTVKEPFLAIVNLREHTLTVVSREAFCERHKIKWADDVINASSLKDAKEKKAYKQAVSCKKALLETDYGFGTTNLEEVKAGDYVGIYEGVYSLRKQPDLNKVVFSSDKEAKISLDRYILGFGSKSKIAGFVSAKEHRGFSGFMQHLPNEYEIKAYKRAKKADKIAVENVKRAYFGQRVLFQAKTKIPPLSHLGFSYTEYWCDKDEDPVPFSQRTGFSLPQEQYSWCLYFINFVSPQFKDDYYENSGYSTEELRTMVPKGSYRSMGDVLCKSEHLDPIRNLKTRKIKLRSRYTMVFIPACSAEDYRTIADYYFLGHPAEERHSLNHIMNVITIYRRANYLFGQEKNSLGAIHCQIKIKEYQKELRELIPVDEKSIVRKKLLQRYKTKKDKSLPTIDLALRRAAAMGHTQNLLHLFKLGAALDGVGDSKKTALHQAAIRKKLSIAFLLLSLGANSAIKDDKSKTAQQYTMPGSPLHRAMIAGPKTNPVEVFSSIKLT